jgi:hypothetical protein
MSLRQLYQWVKRESKRWDGVTRHFQENVVVFSRGVAYAQSSQIRKIAGSVPGKADSQRRRLQRFLKGSDHLESFFQGWTRTVVKGLKAQPVVLVVDETKLKEQLAVMVVGVVFEGRCIPLAWRVYVANSSADYPSEGQADMIIGLLQQVRAGMPSRTSVRVLADRGIGTSPRLLRGIIGLGWTFLVRVTKQSKLILASGEEVSFYQQVQQAGESYAASGVVFKRRGRIPAHVRVLWKAGAQERWALVTNDPQLHGWEYAQRMWIEEAFRDLKSHGWQVEASSLTDPVRMTRLWIVLVVAYAWMLFLGQAAVQAGRGVRPKRKPDGRAVRQCSLFREGRQTLLTTAPRF